MPVYTQGSNSCYFIHIPRTAGRYVSKLFLNTDGVHSEHTGAFPYPRFTYGIFTPHLHYPLYCDICPSDIPRITIVRNPYDKFISALEVMSYNSDIDFDSKLSEEFECFKFIFHQILIQNAENNWFLPQNQFISPNTFVWKYEWGFGEDFMKWVEEKTGIKLRMDNHDYEKLAGEVSVGRKYTLSEQSKINVKKLYYQDYIDFNYHL